MTIKTNSILSSQALDDWRGSLTTFNGFTDTRPDQEYSNSNWQDIKNKIAPEIPLLITDKKRGEYFIPCLLKEAPLVGGTLAMAINTGNSTVGKMRSKDHATDTRLLIVDIDGLPENEFETILDGLKAENISYLTYSTYSHGNPAKPGVRARLVIPVDSAINVEDYPSAWQAFNTCYLAGSGDASGSNLYQQQGTWSCEPSRQALAFKMSNDAGVISVASLMAMDGKLQVKEPVGSQNHETYPASDANMVADKCAQIGQFRESRGAEQTEPDWVNCLGVVGHCENGEAVAHAWSSGHEGYNESATEKKLSNRLRYGPTTCNQFRRTNPQGCGGCIQTCNSPITLGRQDSQPMLDNLAIEKPELEKTETASPKSIFEEITPYHEPVDAPALLDEIKTTLVSSIILDDEEANAVTLWIVLTYFIDYVQILALLLINGPEFSCGKTQLLDLIGRMSSKGFPMVNISLAAVFRVIDLYRPTLLFDEADQFFRSNKDIAGLINAGHSPTSANVIRLVGEDHIPRNFSVWCPKVVAGIAIQKHLPSATMSRGIVINMRRKMKHEKVKRIRHADLNGCDILQSKLARFALDCGEKISLSRPDMPDELSDRQQDNWEPLFAIAECVSSEWVVRANAAALKLSANAEPSASINNELLGDIQQVFEIKKIDKISTVNLIEELVKNDEAPWSGFNRGKPITPRQLAKTLDTYGIKSKTVRTQFGTPKGYTRDQFRDVFDRYLSPSESDLHTEKMPQLRNDSQEAMPIMGSDVAAKTQLETQRNADENVAADVSRNTTPAATPEASPIMVRGGVADVAINIEPQEEAF